MFDPSLAIGRAMESASEPQELCRRLTEQYLASNDADKTALATALVVELAARVTADRIKSRQPATTSQNEGHPHDRKS